MYILKLNDQTPMLLVQRRAKERTGSRQAHTCSHFELLVALWVLEVSLRRRQLIHDQGENVTSEDKGDDWQED